MLEPEVVRHVRQLRERGWGSRRIARELEISSNTVRRYLRAGARAEVQEQPRARLLGAALREEALCLILEDVSLLQTSRSATIGSTFVARQAGM
jgi:orotate phosphoribosyltransferase-like protein